MKNSIMRKSAFLLLGIFSFSGTLVVGWANPSNAQSCTPGEIIVRDVAHNQARTGDGPLIGDGSPLVRQVTFTAEPEYMIVDYQYIQQGSWGKTSRRIDEFGRKTTIITSSDIESVKGEMIDYIGGKVSILDKIKIDARQRLEQLSNQYLSLAMQAKASNATLQLTLEAIPRSQYRTSAIWGFLRVRLKCVGVTNQNDLRLALRREVDLVLNQVPPPPPGKCPGTYSRQVFGGHTGQIAFFNEWNTPVTVVLYHPNNGQIYNRYTVAPKQNNYLGNNVVIGDDWGVCFENKPSFSGVVNNAGAISEYNSGLFMIQNPRIR